MYIEVFFNNKIIKVPKCIFQYISNKYLDILSILRLRQVNKALNSIIVYNLYDIPKKIRIKITNDVIKQHKHVKYLHLMNNGKVDDINCLQNLVKLHASWKISHASIKNLVNIEDLDIQNTCIDNVDHMNKLKRITVNKLVNLNNNHNNLEELIDNNFYYYEYDLFCPPHTINNLKYLKKNFGNRNLNIQNLEYLTCVNLQNITQSDFEKFSTCKFLKHVIIETPKMIILHTLNNFSMLVELEISSYHMKLNECIQPSDNLQLYLQNLQILKLKRLCPFWTNFPDKYELIDILTKFLNSSDKLNTIHLDNIILHTDKKEIQHFLKKYGFENRTSLCNMKMIFLKGNKLITHRKYVEIKKDKKLARQINNNKKN